MKPNKKKVETLLMKYGKTILPKAPQDDNGNLDTKALQDLPETKALINTLKDLGVTDREWLRKNGFLVGSMILKF